MFVNNVKAYKQILGEAEHTYRAQIGDIFVFVEHF
jgi:hypothetical protein